MFLARPLVVKFQGNEPTRHTLKPSRKSGCGTSTRQAER